MTTISIFCASLMLASGAPAMGPDDGLSEPTPGGERVPLTIGKVSLGMTRDEAVAALGPAAARGFSLGEGITIQGRDSSQGIDVMMRLEFRDHRVSLIMHGYRGSEAAIAALQKEWIASLSALRPPADLKDGSGVWDFGEGAHLWLTQRREGNGASLLIRAEQVSSRDEAARGSAMDPRSRSHWQKLSLYGVALGMPRADVEKIAGQRARAEDGSGKLAMSVRTSQGNPATIEVEFAGGVATSVSLVFVRPTLAGRADARKMMVDWLDEHGAKPIDDRKALWQAPPSTAIAIIESGDEVRLELTGP